MTATMHPVGIYMMVLEDMEDVADLDFHLNEWERWTVLEKVKTKLIPKWSMDYIDVRKLMLEMELEMLEEMEDMEEGL